MALDRDRLLRPAKKLRKLISQIDNESAPEQVHDLRTNTRRFEAAFEALSLDRKGIGKTTLKKLGRLRKLAGKVRDLDVLTGFASNLHPPGEQECRVQLLEHLGSRRKKEGGKLSAEAKRLRSSLRKDLKRSASVLAKLLRESEATTNRNPPPAEAAASAVKLAAQLGTPPRLGRANLHPYRLKVKELRNVLRMASASSQHRFIDDLGNVKDAIGEWHDWEELISIAHKVLKHGTGCGLQAELKRTAGEKYDHALSLAQKLRKTYLRPERASGKGASAAVRQIPRPTVLEAANSLLAG
jgi:CHAD domain-containing protein